MNFKEYSIEDYIVKAKKESLHIIENRIKKVPMEIISELFLFIVCIIGAIFKKKIFLIAIIIFILKIIYNRFRKLSEILIDNKNFYYINGYRKYIISLDNLINVRRNFASSLSNDIYYESRGMFIRIDYLKGNELKYLEIPYVEFIKNGRLIPYEANYNFFNADDVKKLEEYFIRNSYENEHPNEDYSEYRQIRKSNDKLYEEKLNNSYKKEFVTVNNPYHTILGLFIIVLIVVAIFFIGGLYGI